MTVMRCSRDGCRRLISVSALPGGNPVARDDPDGYAMVFQTCTSCGRHFCDRCVRRRRARASCSACGHELREPEASLQLALAPPPMPSRVAQRGLPRDPARVAPPMVRTAIEASCYTALHDCPCNQGGPGDMHVSVIDLDDGLGLEHRCVCRSCGRDRRIVFRRPPLDGTSGVSFGPGTSDLIDAAEWLRVAEMTFDMANRVDPATSEPTMDRAVGTAGAVAAVQQAIAFIPPDQHRVPDDAFWSARAVRMRAAEPDLFTRPGLLELMRRYDPNAAGPPTSSATTPPAPAPPAPPAPRAPVPSPSPPTPVRTGTRETARRTFPVPPVLAPTPLRLDLPGRCPAGSFAPDGSELAVASGFTRADGRPRGEVNVVALATGRRVQRHEFDAYEVRLVHTGGGVIVADWQQHPHNGGVTPGELVRYTREGREVLLADAGINPMTQTLDGFAAITHQGNLVVGSDTHLSVLPPVGPISCLAADPVTGRLAVGGDRLVITGAGGAVLAAASVPRHLHHVAFLGPDRLISADPASVRLWRVDGESLWVIAETDRLLALASLAALPARNLVIGTDHQRTVRAAVVDADGFHVVAPPVPMHGRLVWASPTGDLVALPDQSNDSEPPAPDRVEVHDTRAWTTT